MKRFNTLLAVVLASFPFAASAAGPTSPGSQERPANEGGSGEAVTIRLRDGSSLRARVIVEDAHRLKIVTLGGVAMEIERTSIDRIERGGNGSESTTRPSDSNSTRLLFSPTGRPLARGEGYFSDHYVLFPGGAYGITDDLSVGAGFSVIPGLGLSEQVFYVSSRLGKQFSERVAVSAGLLYAHEGSGDDNGLGVGFAMTTIGKPDKSLTLGMALARTVSARDASRYENGRWIYDTRREASHTPVVLIGGTARLSHRVAFVSENWLALHDDFRLRRKFPGRFGVTP